MTEGCARVCSVIVGELFGPVAEDVVAELFRKGRCSLRQLGLATKFPLSLIQSALKVLIQHFVVNFHTSPMSGEVVYTASPEGAVEFLRFPRYYVHVESVLGELARGVLEEVAQAGLVSVSKLLHICGHRWIEKGLHPVTEEVLFKHVELCQGAIVTLVSRKYITIFPINSSPPDGEVPEERESRVNSSLLFTVPAVDLKQIVTKLLQSLFENKSKENEMKGKGKQKPKKSKQVEVVAPVGPVIDLETFPDADILWRVNLLQFHTELRNQMVFKGVAKKFSSVVDPRVLEVVMELGFEKHPWEGDGAPVSLPEIRDRMERLPDGQTVSKFAADHLEVIEQDPMGILSRLSNTQGGHFSFNMKAAITHLMWSCIDRIIAEKHGYQALRIFRLVKNNEFLEQDNINEVGMIPGKDAKNLTYKLVEDGFLNIKEIRKVYSTTAPPGKSCTVFYVDKTEVIRSIQQICYKALLNLKLKTKFLEEKIQRLVVKEERIQRTLLHMSKKECNEEQLKEVRELLTPPERSLLLRYEHQSEKLLSGSLQIDETLLITEFYMRYHSKHNPSSAKKSNNNTR